MRCARWRKAHPHDVPGTILAEPVARMIALPAINPAPVSAPVPAKPGVPPRAGVPALFALSLASLLGPPADSAPGMERQDDADDGTALPLAAPDDNGYGGAAAVPFGWLTFAAPLAPAAVTGGGARAITVPANRPTRTAPMPLPVPMPGALHTASPATVPLAPPAGDIALSTGTSPLAPGMVPSPATSDARPLVTTAPSAASDANAGEASPPSSPPPDQPPVASRGPSVATLAFRLPLTDPVEPNTPASTTTAGTLFAGAIAAAAPPKLRDEPALPPSVAGAAPVELPRHAVAAMAEAQQAPLDLAQPHWPERMIDRIATLREAAADQADAADTRIRLIPDALGTIDVAVRRDGDAVHVHFAADQPATRQLLADAQPQLADLAAARGLRLGGSGVGGGSAGTQPQYSQQHRPARPVPARPRPAGVTDHSANPDDLRIA